jgi:hypothetical protein
VPASGEAGHDSILLVRCVDASVAEIPQEFWVISGCGTRDLAEKIAFIFRRSEERADQVSAQPRQEVL